MSSTVEDNATVWDPNKQNRPFVQLELPTSLIDFVDEAVKEKLPPENSIISISAHGSSYWARTAKILTEDPDGEEVSFFIKVHQGAERRLLCEGEFIAMTALHKTSPTLCPKPIAFGTYVSTPDVWFYLSEFVDMVDEAPSSDEFAQTIAELHKNGVDPDGMFGWPHPVFSGTSAQIFPLSKSWEETFSRGIQQTFALETASQGHDDELSRLETALVEKVIPRLLRPLQTEGRNIMPTLVHGDLWDGNVALDADTGDAIIFDPTAMYAHNEYELAPWGATRHKIGPKYIKQYLKYMPASEPTEDFDDRVLLYEIRYNMGSSHLYPGNLRRRELGRHQIRQLVEKYAGDYEDEVQAQNADNSMELNQGSSMETDQGDGKKPDQGNGRLDQDNGEKLDHDSGEKFDQGNDGEKLG